MITSKFYIQSKIGLSNWVLTASTDRKSVHLAHRNVDDLNQHWQREDDSRGGFVLYNVGTGKVLQRTTSQGGRVELMERNNSDSNQLWRQETWGSWVGINTLVDWEQKLNVSGGGPYNETTPIILWEYSRGGENESWQFVPVPEITPPGHLMAGQIVILKCLGNIDGPRYLDGRTGDGTVGLAPVTTGVFTGTQWAVEDAGEGAVYLKCLGNIDGPRYLDGRTGDGTVGLAPVTTGIYTGTRWAIDDETPDRIALKCLGNIDGPRYLDGRTGDGTVGLAPVTTGAYSGAHWQVNAVAQTKSVTPEGVARALAPIIRLHSQDPHRPTSVEWFLSRCQLVRGQGTLSSGPANAPSGLEVIDPGPMTPNKLAAASSSTQFGGGEIDDISLFPLPASIGSKPTADWSWVSLLSGYFTDIGENLPDPSELGNPDPYFYNYQLQTLLGQQHGGPQFTCTVPIYVRIATQGDYYLISYFGFFAYNGGLGPQTDYTARPLANGSGFDAHIGDWVRLTAKVKINQNLVSLIDVDYEAHGNSNIITDGAFEDLPLSQVPRLTAYAAWHSHEMYPNAGRHLRSETGFTANDYTDDGPVWDTAANLQFISDAGPSWVRYNGLWGANMTVPGAIKNYLKNGPQGPAFHGYWIRDTHPGSAPIKQWYPFVIPPGEGPVDI
jgi:hypothetical protein